MKKHIQYFGTNISAHGHYIWDVYETELRNESIDFSKLSFNPEELPSIDKRKGSVSFHHPTGYSICQIEGSCIDNRGGTKSVFFVQGQISNEELIYKIESIPILMAIINKMPFKVDYFSR